MPASENARAEAAALRDGVAHGGDEFEFVAAVAHRGDAGRQIDRSPLDLLEVGVHVPEAGQNGFAVSIDDVRVLGNLYLARGPAATMRPLSNHDGRVGDGAAPVPSMSVPPTIASVELRLPAIFLEIGQRAHAVGAGASDEIAERAFVAFADGFEVIELGVGRDGGDQIAIRVKPERLASPDQSFDGVAVEFLVFRAFFSASLVVTRIVSCPRGSIFTVPLGSVASCAGDPCVAQ